MAGRLIEESIFYDLSTFYYDYPNGKQYDTCIFTFDNLNHVTILNGNTFTHQSMYKMDL